MIVCLCHRVSDRDIAAAVAGGVTCFDVLQDETRVASACGCCHDCARETFDAACAQRSAHDVPQPVLPATSAAMARPWTTA